MNNKRKRILFVHHGEGIGGAPISLLQMVCALDLKKYEPIVLFLHDSDAVDLFKERGITILGPVNRYDFQHTKIWWYRLYHPHHMLRSLRDSWCLLRGEVEAWIKKVKPDIVHLNTSSLLVWGIIAKRLKIPVVWHIREPLAPGYFGIRRWLVKYVVGKYADIILPICKNDAKPWIHLKKTHVLYNAVDLKRFDSKKQQAVSVPTIFFLGGLSREKGTHIILQAFAKLLKRLSAARLVIAGYWGDGNKSGWRAIFGKSPAEKFKDEAERLLKPIKNSVELVGAIKNVPEVMAKSSCVVFPATVGHFARPIIESG
ncbi:glycosyltransferase family 4 protein, partial [Candidatus Babeliales bacterium]|nr:glycosyltransferase family 4 protein [Candidatus Babeliales bacterium]